MLLTGLVTCGADGCGSGLAIRTGKGGRYSYYTCNAKITAGAGACPAKAIRQDELDRIVTDTLLDSVLQPARLKELLAEDEYRTTGIHDDRRFDRYVRANLRKLAKMTKANDGFANTLRYQG